MIKECGSHIHALYFYLNLITFIIILALYKSVITIYFKCYGSHPPPIFGNLHIRSENFKSKREVMFMKKLAKLLLVPLAGGVFLAACNNEPATLDEEEPAVEETDPGEEEAVEEPAEDEMDDMEEPAEEETDDQA